MISISFELDRLRHTLFSKGVDDRTISSILVKAKREIDEAIEDHGKAALDRAVEIGAEKESVDFINELRFNTLHFEIDTDSHRLDFSEPPRPMLPFLLKNAKLNKDGTGSYKVIPVGKPGNKPKVTTSIIDAQKRIVAERIEHAKERQRAMAPAGSISFRVASSKQDATTQWVLPEKKKDFTEEVKAINQELTMELDNAIREIIRSYEEMF